MYATEMWVEFYETFAVYIWLRSLCSTVVVAELIFIIGYWSCCCCCSFVLLLCAWSEQIHKQMIIGLFPLNRPIAQIFDVINKNNNFHFFDISFRIGKIATIHRKHRLKFTANEKIDRKEDWECPMELISTFGKFIYKVKNEIAWNHISAR